MRRLCLDPFAIRIRALGSDKSAAAAVEFALVGSLFIVLILVVLEFGLFLFARAALDSGTQSAARTIQLGNPNGFPTTLCNQLPVFMSSSKLSYYVQQGSSFGAMSPAVSYNTNGVLNNGSAQTCPAPAPGAVPGSPYVIVQVSYKWTFLIPWIATVMHIPAVVLVSTAAFENE